GGRALLASGCGRWVAAAGGVVLREPSEVLARGPLLVAVHGRRRRPRQLLAGHRLDERHEPARIVEHGRAHVHERVEAVDLREQPTLAVAAEMVPVLAVQAADHGLALRQREAVRRDRGRQRERARGHPLTAGAVAGELQERRRGDPEPNPPAAAAAVASDRSAAHALLPVRWDGREPPVGAGTGGRTHTVSPPPDFESGASTNSAIPARGRILRASGPARPARCDARGRPSIYAVHAHGEARPTDRSRRARGCPARRPRRARDALCDVRADGVYARPPDAGLARARGGHPAGDVRRGDPQDRHLPRRGGVRLLGQADRREQMSDAPAVRLDGAAQRRGGARARGLRGRGGRAPHGARARARAALRHRAGGRLAARRRGLHAPGDRAADAADAELLEIAARARARAPADRAAECGRGERTAMYTRLEDLLTIRDGEPIDASTRARLLADPHCVAEIERLRSVQQALEDLPELAPPPGAWAAIAARTAPPPPRRDPRLWKL